MDFLRSLRNEFFKAAGKSRIKRICVLTFFLAVYWCAIDWVVYKNLTSNLWHDLCVLFIGIVLERCLPWGKQQQNKKG